MAKRTGTLVRGLPSAVRSRVGWLRLPKAGGAIFFRSALEGDVLLALQYAHDVATLERNDLQPAERVHFRLGRSPAANKTFELEGGRRHTPDLRVVRQDGSIVYVQVGTLAAKSAPAMAEFLEAARVQARAEGSDLVVLTERIRRGYWITNLGRIHKRRQPAGVDGESPEHFAALAASARQYCVERYPDRCVVPEVARALRAAVSEVDEREAEGAVWAAIGEAEEQGRLRCDLQAARFDLGARFAIAPDGPPLTRGWLTAHLEVQALEPLPLRMPPPNESVVVPTMGLRSTDASADLTRRLAIVRDKERNGHESWAAIARRYRVEEWVARYWWKKYRAGGEAALIGGREPQGIRADAELKAIVRRLATRKLDATKIHRHPDLRRALRETGRRMSYWQVVRYVRFLERTDPLLLEQREERPRLRVSPYYGDPSWLKQVVAPGQVVQVDEGIADALLQSSEAYTVLPRVHILWAIDVATRCVLAWRVCLETPSEVDYRKLLAMVMQPKEALCRELGAELVSPAYCVPELILADRGWIFTATAVREDLLAMGVRCEHAAAYQPQMKPIIERLLGTINDMYIHWLPGTTLSGADKRNGRAVLHEALAEGLTMDEFERALGLAVVDGYHDMPHGGIGKTPLEAWEDGVAQYGAERWPETEAAKLRLRLFQLKRVDGTRKLDPRGYHALDAWVKPMAAAPEVAQLLYDPDDVRIFAVCEGEGPRAGRFVCDAYVSGIDLSVPLTEGELHAIRNPGSKADLAFGEERLASLREKLARGQKLRPKDAVLLERRRRALGAPEPEALRRVPATPAVELELEAKPDYAAL